MDSFIFYIEEEGVLCPVIAVNSAVKVVIQLPDKTTKTVRFKGVQWAEKELPPIGRITLGKVQGTILRETYIDDNFISGMGETVQDFEIVADRDIPDCYVALIYEFSNGQKRIAFGHIGDLKAGEFSNHAVVFPNIEVPIDTRYKYEFFSHGLPLEMHRLNRVASNLRSHSLLIPWNKRLEQYLFSASNNNLNRQPQLFARKFEAFNTTAIKERGIKTVKVDLLIKTDGSGELVRADDQLTADERLNLASDVAKWQFFPPTKAGKPFQMKVAVPMQF